MGPEPSAAQSGQGPLVGRVVVLTRSTEDNRSLASALAERGATAIEVPLVEVLPPQDDGAALSAAVERLDRYRWVVLTSVNGVRAVAAALGDRPWPAGVTVAPVGPTTEAAARAHGFDVVAPPSVATVEHLVAGFAPIEQRGDGATPDLGSVDVDDALVLAPVAELAGDTVVDGLGAKGYTVDRVTAYRTAAPTATPTDPDPEMSARVAGADAVAFFSPSVVDRFVARFATTSLPAIALCIGPSTGARAGEHHLRGIVIAEPHSEAGLIAAAEAALATP